MSRDASFDALLETYAHKVAELKKLEGEVDAMRAGVLIELTGRGFDKLQTPLGTFSVAKQVKWEYEQEVKMMEEMLAQRKEYDRENGKATPKEVEALRFVAKASV